MKNKLQNVIKHIKTMFYNKVSGQFKKSQIDTISINEKKTTFDKIKKIFMFNLKDIGIRDFKDANRLKTLLTKKFNSEDFKDAIVKIILNETRLKNWLFITKENFWFVIDNGHKSKVYCVKRKELKYTPEEIEGGFANLIIPTISYPIMFDKSLTGSTASFTNYLDSYNG